MNGLGGMNLNTNVLILILVEDALWALTNSRRFTKNCWVLILILVEDALWEQNFQTFYYQIINSLLIALILKINHKHVPYFLQK